MDKIVEQLILLNSRDWIDIGGTLIPIIISLFLLYQNHVISQRNEILQKQIHRRDILNQAHDDVLKIYRTYYDFCDALFTSNLAESVRHADVTAANYHLQGIYNMKREILQNLDLARLLFSQAEFDTFAIIEDRFNNMIKLLDMYHDYIFSRRLDAVSENAWNTVLANAGNSLYKDTMKYNYQELRKNLQMYNNFVALCRSPELEAINKQIDIVIEKHSYENYDKYFEKFLRIEG